MSVRRGGETPLIQQHYTNDRSGTREKRPAFEPPQQIREQLLARNRDLERKWRRKPARPIQKHPEDGSLANASRKWKSLLDTS
jgi:hypothetical protein